MRGQQTLIRLRLAGHKPRYVWVLALEGPCPKGQYADAEHSLENDGYPEIHVGADENPATLDFRCLTGTTVLLQAMSPDRQRVRAIFPRIKVFEPARIIVSGCDFLHDYTPKRPVP